LGVKIKGVVIPGFNRGAGYVRAYRDKFKDKLGFEPFEGTLNIKLEEGDMEKVKQKISVNIGGFERDGREFGGVGCVPVRVEGIDCCAILPEKSRHKDVVEIIHPFNLSEKLGLRNGDMVEINL